MKKVVLNVILFLLISNGYAWTQGGSNYSVFGLGDIVFGQTASSQAMGGTQIAYSSNNTINMFNPALWSKVKTTRIQTGYRFNQNIIDNDNNTLWQNNGAINGFYSLFNFDTTREISAAFMFQPITSVNYFMSANIFEDSHNPVGNRLYRGSGGINNLTLGIGTKIINGIYVGASVSAAIGKIEHYAQSTFHNSYSIDYQINDINIISGANYNIGLFFNPITTLGIGLFYKISPKAHIEQRQEYLYYPQTALNNDTTIVNTNRMKLPDFFGAGLSYTLKKYMFNIDYLTANFADINIYKTGQNNFSDMQRFSLGMILLGNPNQFATLTERAAYKIGAYYEKQYYKINDNQINEFGITGGFQFPISRTAQIDFALSFGRRGNTNNGLLKEMFGKMMIDISIGDNWFKPIKLDH